MVRMRVRVSVEMEFRIGPESGRDTAPWNHRKVKL